MHRFRIVAAALALGCLTFSAHAADDTINRTFNVQPGGRLTVDADLGDLTVRTAATNQVSVHITRHGRASDLQDYAITFSQDGSNVSVIGKNPRNFHFFDWNNLEAHFTITVPQSYNLNLDTSGGNIKVSDLHGEVIAKTSGGDLEMGHIEGNIDARTSGGDVKLDGARGKVDLRTSGGEMQVGNVDGPLSVKTSGGSISLKRVTGDLYAHTSGGGIEVEEALGTVDASTSGGSIRARLGQQPRGDSKLSTSGGSITVSLAGNIGVDLDAHTSGGDIDADMPITVLGRQTESTLNGKVNGGGPKLVLRSSGGGIRVRKM